ncbi:MAG: hypothetical protein OEY29_04960 [Gammaproteobacteria bacterium]|nr:hypothetical protein [Gammaproteobacteria bacterium]
MKKLFILVLTISTLGCASVSSYSDVHINDRIELNQNLGIQPNDARVSIQYGKVLSHAAIKNYYPHCWFVSWQRKDQPQIIHKDIFIITKVRQLTSVVRIKSGAYPLAALLSQAGISAMEYTTEMEIYSERQAVIKKLICSHWEDPYNASHLSLQSMQKTLGDIATIRSSN